VLLTVLNPVLYDEVTFSCIT